MKKIFAKGICAERFLDSAGELETTSYSHLTWEYDVPNGYVETKKDHPASIEVVKTGGEHLAWLTKAWWVCGGEVFPSAKECSESEFFHPGEVQIALTERRAEEIAAEQAEAWGE